jgi:DNA-binding LacI/PurR family transcriptional regulator
VDVVRTDDVAGSRLAVEYLAGLGHQSIAHVDGQRAPGAAERRRGYRAAMRDLGLQARGRVVAGGLTDQDGERAAAELFAGPPPTAVAAFNDHCAAGLMAAARARGVGYDNSHIASLATVALTTVAQDAPALAGTALELALARAEHEDAPAADTVLPPQLVIRHTSAPPA